MKKLLLVIPLIVVLISSASTQAKDKKSEAREIQFIASQMQKENNVNFILVYAYLDGIVKEGKPYNIEIHNTKVLSYGEALPEPYLKKYSHLLHEFFLADDHTGNAMYSLRGDGIKKDDILDPNSTFRKSPANDENAVVADIKKMKQAAIIKRLDKDGLLNADNNYTISYSPEGIFVNSKKLKGAAYDKYKPLFADLVGHKEETNYSFTISHTP